MFWCWWLANFCHRHFQSVTEIDFLGKNFDTSLYIMIFDKGVICKIIFAVKCFRIIMDDFLSKDEPKFRFDFSKIRLHVGPVWGWISFEILKISRENLSPNILACVASRPIHLVHIYPDVTQHWRPGAESEADRGPEKLKIFQYFPEKFALDKSFLISVTDNIVCQVLDICRFFVKFFQSFIRDLRTLQPSQITVV